jgi:exonuclease SbcC
MIDKFTIENYQIIKNGSILIRPGITLITGPSNNGKSSIFKAYKQIIYNLTGSTYINSFADKCRLILENDNYKITYERTKSKSSYDIFSDGKLSHIDKLGANQLDKVKELTKIDKDLGYNFWDQLEKPFLLDRTNREQFLLLQESPISANLLNIQETIKTDIKSLKDEILVSQGSLDVVNNNITKQEAILSHSDLVHEVSTKASTVNDLNRKLNSLMTKVKEFSATEKELEKYKDLTDVSFDNKIDTIYNKFNIIEGKIKTLTKITTDCNNSNIEISTISKDLSTVEEIISKEFSICPLCGNVIDENHNNI